MSQNVPGMSAAAKLKQLLAEKAKQRAAAELANQLAQQEAAKHVPLAAKPEAALTAAVTAESGASPVHHKQFENVVLNEEQLQAVDLASQGKAYCLIGPAGSGKTTTIKEVVKTLKARLAMRNPNGQVEAGSFALVSFTNRAVRNIARATKDVCQPGDCQTIHAFLGYHPEYFEVMDPVSGDFRNTMRFVPEFHAGNPKHDVVLVVVEESSMVSTELFGQLRDACPNATFIFIGDLNQLAPVFGDAILGFQLVHLPVIELSKIYRQAMDSPIIAFQHQYTLQGKLPSATELDRISASCTDTAGLKFTAFRKEHPDPEFMAEVVAGYMIRQLDSGLYDPEQDTILIPYNKAMGSILVNGYIAEHLAKKEERKVYEIISGYETHYYAVDDFVLYNKREYKISKIERNSRYMGKQPVAPGTDLNRWGMRRAKGSHDTEVMQLDAADPGMQLTAEEILNMTSAESDEKLNSASHIVYMTSTEDGHKVEAKTSGEVNDITFGYCMTIHKAQGSEWRRVWLVLSKHHRTMLSRELLYTGMTRARERLEVLYTAQSVPGKKDSSIAKAIARQQIPGRTWREKVERYFAGKAGAQKSRV